MRATATAEIPTMIKNIGNKVSIPKVFISLTYINNFFLVRAFKWSIKTFVSCYSDMVYSSRSVPES